MSVLNVYKRRSNTILVQLGVDVSEDEFVSEIRVDKNYESDLIATWEIT